MLLLFISLFIPLAKEAVVPGVTALVILLLLDLGVLIVMVELDIFVIVVAGKSASFTSMSLQTLEARTGEVCGSACCPADTKPQNPVRARNHVTP